MARSNTTRSPKTSFMAIKNIAKQVTPEEEQDKSQGILNWSSKGLNNDFPQYLLNLIDRSPTAQALIETYQQYLFGSGIIEPEISDLKINSIDTVNDLLDKITKDFAPLRGYAIKCKFAINGEEGLVLHSASQIPFEATRLGINNTGFVTHIVYNPYFGTKDHNPESNKNYCLFTTDKAQIASDITKEGYNGHILWRADNKPNHRFYPYTPLASASDWIGCDGEIQKFHYNNIASGFLLKAVMSVYGDPQAAVEEREVTVNGVKQKETVKTAAQALEDHLKKTVMGSDGVQVLIQWIQDAKEAPKLESFTPNTYESTYKELQELITEELARTMQIPTQLANINSNAALNQSGDLLSNAVYLMQSRIERYHMMIVRDLSDILKLKGSTTEFNIGHYSPFPNKEHLEKFWEIASTQEKKQWINENTMFEVGMI